MAVTHNNTNDKRRRDRRSQEGGWVLMATLVLSTIVVSVTVTYARHAVLAKKSLEVASGASAAEEASRSGLERTRERMEEGYLPGTEEEGTEDVVETPTGEIVISEREVIDHDDRKLKVEARGNGGSFEDEATLKAKGRVTPGHGKNDSVTSTDCDTGTMLAGLVTIISGDVTYQGTELAGLFLLEEGATLTLDDIVLRGTIITRAGMCKDNLPHSGSSRPAVNVYGGLRHLAGTELPDTAVLGPDLVYICDSQSRVELEGMVVTDEFEVRGRGTVKGMVVSKKDPVFSSNCSRPGNGRGLQSWPESIEPASENVKKLTFPFDQLDDATLDLMDTCDD